MNFLHNTSMTLAARYVARVGSSVTTLVPVPTIVGTTGAGPFALVLILPRVAAKLLGGQKPLLPTRRLSQKYRKRFGKTDAGKPIKDVNRRQRLRGLVHILADKWFRYLVNVQPRLARGKVVPLERYFYDLLTYPHPLIEKPWLESLVTHLISKPAIIFSLEADPALIAARKNKLTTAETARQIQCFHELKRWVEDLYAVPAAGDISAVVDSMTEHVMRLYSCDRSPEMIPV